MDTEIHALGATDPENDALTFTITEGNIAGAFKLVGDKIVVADASKLDYETVKQFVLKVEVSDGSLSTVAIITINITDVEETTPNQAPVLVDISAEVEEDGILSGTSLLVNASDPEGGSLTISTTPVKQPEHGELVIHPDGTYTYKPEPDFFGTDSFIYAICDNGSPVSCTQGTVTITVNSVNDAPEVGEDKVIVTEGSSVIGNLLANDTDKDGDQLIINTVPVSAPANGSLTINPDGTFVYTPAPGFKGTDSFTYEVCDDQQPAACSQGVVTIVVSPYDSDGDGIPDHIETGPDPNNPRDTDGDGIPDYLDTDSDGDGIPDRDEAGDNAGSPADSDGDGIPDYLDEDDDNDGVPTRDEIDGAGDVSADCDNDGIPDYRDGDGCGSALNIPLGFSPNNDFNGDEWIIEGIEEYPANKVRVFNRWGNTVFETSGYNNRDKVWRGESNGKMTPGKKEVPDGTYFYVLDLGDGSKLKSGYIIIRR